MEQLQTQEQKHLEFVNLTIKNLIGGHDFIYWEQIASLPMIKADKDWAHTEKTWMKDLET